MMSDKIVMIDSDDSAVYRTNISGWVSRHGFFFGDNPASERISVRLPKNAKWS